MRTHLLSRIVLSLVTACAILAGPLALSSHARPLTETVMHVTEGDSSSVIVKKLPPQSMAALAASLSQERSTFLVTSIGDAPDDSIADSIYFPFTLRSAIENANLTPGADVIIFAVGITEISPLTELPPVDFPLEIADIILDGTNIVPQVGVGQYGLTFRNGAAGSVVENIEIRNFPDAGIFIGVNNVTVQGCEIHGNEGAGILTNAVKGCTIGGLDSTAQANFIYNNSGTSGDGIQLFEDIFGNPSDSNLIAGNFIGTEDGLTASPNERSGIAVWGGHNRISDNVVSGNNYDGIRLGDDLDNPSMGNIIEDNVIGLTFEGLDTLPNGIGNVGEGIYIRYGESDTIVSNLIGGNIGHGIEFATAGNRAYIANNLIGVDTANNARLGNSGSGMFLRGNDNFIKDNHAGANLNGVHIIGDSNTVRGNILGSDDDTVLANTVSGLQLSGNHNVVGGQNLVDENVCSGNALYGITVSGAGSTGNRIQNNLIGLDKSGTVVVPNLRDGIRVSDSTQGTFIVDNQIAGNDSSGIRIASIFGRRPRGTILEGNEIGDLVFSSQGNGRSGVTLEDAVETYIGNPASGIGNRIRANAFYGIEIRSADSTIVYKNEIRSHLGSGIVIDSGLHNRVYECTIDSNAFHGVYIDTADSTFIYLNTIEQNEANGVSVISGSYNQIFENAILNNGLLGIDIGNDGVTLNDPNDLDAGPNMYQNFPFISSVNNVNDTLFVIGELDGMPFTDYIIDMYASFACDSSGYGEGQEWIDSTSFTSGASGTSVINFASASTYDPSLSNLTFTATDGDGNTSEFSPCFELVIEAADVELTNIADQDTVMVGDTVTFTMTVENNGPAAATGTTVIDSIPPEMSYVSDTATQGSCTVVNDVLTCTVGTLTSGGSATITLLVTADSVALVSNTPFASANESDPIPQNNSSTAEVEIIDPATAITPGGRDGLPTEFALSQNYPNPFNPSTEIEFSLPERSEVILTVYNVLGEQVAELVRGAFPAGYYVVDWNGRDHRGHEAASGVYLYRLTTDRYTSSRKMLLLK